MSETRFIGNPWHRDPDLSSGLGCRPLLPFGKGDSLDNAFLGYGK